jgi:pimeloyl-ACP methyl ester carboxylesterase
MDDALSIDEMPSAASSRGLADLRGRAMRLARGIHRLGGLYFAQTRLIFAGHVTQGKPYAVVKPEVGTELVPLRTQCGQKTFAYFGPATTIDGQILPDARARPTILFFYGNKGSLADPHVTHLFDGLRRRLGVNVLIPEYLGYGMSTGDACEAGCYSTANAAYAHLLQRTDIDPTKIIAAGASLGGAVAIDLASRENLAGLITLITFTSMPDMARLIQPTLPIWRFIKHRFESEQKMPRVKCPSLIIHSTGDALVPYEMADRLAGACGGPVSRVKIDGAGHNSVEMLEGGGGIIYEAMKTFLSKP